VGYQKENPEKLATWGTQDEEKQSRNRARYEFGTALTTILPILFQ
jgi:hypothetical protein